MISRRRRKKKFQYLILGALTALILISGVMYFLLSGKTENLGHITGTKNTELTAAQEKDPYLDSSKKYKIYNSGYANLSIPYPADYQRETEASNKIKFTYGTNEIYVEIGNTNAGQGDMADKLEDFISQFKYRLTHETILDTYYRYEDQEEKASSSALKDINNKAEKRICQEYPKLRLSNYLGEYSTQTMYERRYYLRENGTDLMIAIISEEENKKTAGKVINYIVKNIKAYKESPKSVSAVAEGITLSLPETFESSSTVSTDYGNSNTYRVSATASSSIAGTYIHIFDVADNFSFEKDYVGGFSDFCTEYARESSVMDNVSTGGTISKDDTGFLASKIWDRLKIEDAYYDDITICRTASDGSILLEDGKSFTVEAYKAKTSSGTKIITVGYLTDKSDVVIEQIGITQ